MRAAPNVEERDCQFTEVFTLFCSYLAAILIKLTRCASIILLVAGIYIITLIYLKVAPSAEWHYATLKDTHFEINHWNAEKFKTLFSYDGVWLIPQNQCSCPTHKGLTVYNLSGSFDPKDFPSAKERRNTAFIQHKKRLEASTQTLLIAPPNSPLSYPIQGLEVMPLHTVRIPGLGVHGIQRSSSKVTLTAALGILSTLAEVPEDVVKGQGKKQMHISFSSLEKLNIILQTITYTSKVYTVDSVDLVHFQFDTHVAVFPIRIRQPEIPKLFDPGKENNVNALVTITTKTFLRYHKLKALISSIRKFYPEMTIIIADDNENPEKIEDPHLEQYFMPFAKGWFAGRNLAVSQVTTKYFLWVDDDFLFTENTKIEKLVTVLEETTLDLVGGSVGGNRFCFRLLIEEGNDEGDCLHYRSGHFHFLEGFSNCVVTSGVANFFLARTQEVRKVGFDPKLSRVAHSEFFIDGLGMLSVGSCKDVSVAHQSHSQQRDEQLLKMEKKYAGYRKNTNEQYNFKLREHFFKNRLKCFSKM